MTEGNLLKDKLIPASNFSGDETHFTLPGLLSALAEGDISTINRVKSYQEQALHQFLVQISVMGCDLCGESSLVANEAEWEKRLLALAPESAWDVYNENPGKAAFMQPAMDKETFENALLKTGSHKLYPDNLTVLIQSKNHHVKFGKMDNATLWDWCLSLIEVQTLSGFEGKGLYGASRMNGGYGTRVKVGLYPRMDASSQWNRDTKLILDNLTQALSPFYDRTGLKAPANRSDKSTVLWIEPWTGGKDDQIPFAALHPLYVDISRLLRLVPYKNGYKAVYATTEGYRLNTEMKGALGDPWLPIKEGKEKEETTFSGFTPKKFDIKTLCSLLFENTEIKDPFIQRILPDDPEEMIFQVSALIGGQGGTEGYHDIRIPIPTKVKDPMFADEAAMIGQRAQEMLKDMDAARKAVRSGVFAFVQVAKTKDKDINNKDHDLSSNAYQKAYSRLQRDCFDQFFSHLWQLSETDDRTDWVRFLKNTALSAFEYATKASTTHAQLAYKAQAKASLKFNIVWAAHFKSGENND